MLRMIKRLPGPWLAVVLTLAASMSTAQDQPAGQVILQVSGSIGVTNADGAMNFDRDMLDALGTFEVVTETPWTEGAVAFQGVLARDLMAAVGASGTVVDAVALNDYTVSIPMSDFERYDVILATRIKGVPMRVRDRGPIWIIYPWSAEPELQNELYYSRSIWQLKALDVGLD